MQSTGRVFANDAMEFLTNWQVATLPMFLMMGSFAVAAGISEDIYRVANAFLGRIKGGLAYATIAGCAGFGAVSGSSVVPPSGAIILFALLTEQSIGVLFIAAMVPALLALLLYFSAIFITLRMNPELAPVASLQKEPVGPALWSAAPVALLFGVVIGGLYGGFFTATESAAVGAVGAFLLALSRGKLSRERLLEVLSGTTATTALIYGLIFGALIFSFYVNLGQAPEFVTKAIGGLDTSPMMILIILLIFYLLLGAVMDSFAVMVITVPVVTPLVVGLGFDIFHWGILMLVVVEIGLITPPFGINLFVLKSLQPDQPLSKVMKGVLPFIAADVVKLALLVAFPALVLWLPSTMNCFALFGCFELSQKFIDQRLTTWEGFCEAAQDLVTDIADQTLNFFRRHLTECVAFRVFQHFHRFKVPIVDKCAEFFGGIASRIGINTIASAVPR